MKLAVLCLLLCACSHSTAPAGPCAARSGSYRVSFHERSGDCGPIAEQVIVIDPMTVGMVTSACTGQNTATADNCSVTVDQVCTLPSGTVSESRGTTHWSEDGMTGGGISQLVLRPGANGPGCSSSYDVSYTRL